MNLFSYGQKKKIAQIASEYVEQHRFEERKRIDDAKLYLIGSQSPVIHKIYESAKLGLLETSVDFSELNKNGELDNFTNAELDQLIYYMTSFLLEEGCNVCIKSQTLLITWPDPHKECAIESNTDTTTS